ncbi:MAG: sigma-70 family RNA polymerase sigma factor [Terracidiphilus sp.]
MGAERIPEETVVADEAAQGNAQMVLAIGAGDRTAEQEFVARYQPRVRAMLLARTRNRDTAADLTQDTMIEAVCALRRGMLREPAKLSAFVLAIARNLLNSHFRGASRSPESLEFPDNLPDPSSLAERAETGDRERRALEAIEALEPTDRAILQLTLIEGLKPGAIARRLDLNPDLVRQRKLRATRRIVEFVTGRSQMPGKVHSMSGQTP